ncbi:MAG: TonB-dependent receptor [Pseudomonadota bacterium]
MQKKKTLVSSSVLVLALCGMGASAIAQDDDDGDLIVVRGAFVPDEKRSTSEISNLLDAEDFQRTGDSDIAAALRRVTGISIVDGKFPVARGLNERYSAATINGVPIPSPEPLRRAAPLDLIPTDLLSGSLAQKTFSPQFSGEFGGAAIDLQTIAVPTNNFFSLSIGFSGDTETTFQEGLFYNGSDTDRFGWDDGSRDLPSIADARARGDFSISGADVARALNEDVTDLAVITIEDNTPVNGEASFSVGRVLVDSAAMRLGTALVVGYSNEFQSRDAIEVRDRANTDVLSVADRTSFLTDRRDYEETRHTVEVTALHTLGVEVGDHEISLTSYFLRSSLKRAQLGVLDQGTQSEFFNEDGGLFEFTDYIEREVWQTQLNGEHTLASLGDLQANWRIAYGEASRDAPQERLTSRDDFTQTLTDTDGNTITKTLNQVVSRRGELNEINFSFLDDTNFYAGLDFEKPLTFANSEVKVLFGGAYTDKERSTSRRQFQLQDIPRRITEGPLTDNVDLVALIEGSRVDVLYSDDVIDLGLIEFQPISNPAFPDESEASLEVFAGYALTDFEINQYLRASIGARFESSTQEASTFLAATPDNVTEVDPIEEDYILPAVTVTWNPLGNLQLRAGYSETITRPQFRELVPTIFNDPDFNVGIAGNPFLENSELTNYDVRGEYYFRRGEFVTLGLFYKDIENPIERVELGTEDNRTTFVNVPSAEIWGIEFEAEKRFSLHNVGFLDVMPGNIFGDKELFAGFNYTYSQSEIDAEGDISLPNQSTSAQEVIQNGVGFLDDGRSLVGQSDHLVNFQLSIENPDTGFKATALLNHASDRILAGGTPAPGGALLPEIVENPPLTVDLLFSRNFEMLRGVYGLQAKVQNLLGEEFDVYREGVEGEQVPYLRYDRGQAFSISLTASF